MKSIFPEFYRLSEDDFKKVWDDCIFVFDANVLLNLYRYSQNTGKGFIQILTDGKIKDRVWIPHQFAFEYQKNRLLVISEQKHSYSQLIKEIESLITKFERHPFLKMKEVMRSAIENIREVAQKHPKWSEVDPIRKILTSLFENKIGEPFKQEELDKIYEEGKIRYAKKIPPGYLDDKKDSETRFGDLIGWKQIMIYAKQVQKPTIFINDEDDEDWWLRIKGELVGARYELTKEIKDFAGVFFCMYNSKLFHKQATKYLKRKVDKKVVEEIKEITEKKRTDDEEKSVSFEKFITPSETQQILSEDVGKSDSSQSSEQKI